MCDETEFHGDTWYLQIEKINREYTKIVPRVEKERKTTTSGLKETELKGKAESGLLVNPFVKANVGGGFKAGTTTSKELIESKEPFNKLLEIVRQYQEDGIVMDLTKINQPLNLEELEHVYVCFKGKAKLERIKTEPSNSQTAFVAVKGETESFMFYSVCSNKFFEEISASSFNSWLAAGLQNWLDPYWKVFCFGYVNNVKKFRGQNCAQIQPWYIGGSTKEINRKYKEEGEHIRFMRRTNSS